MHMLSLTNRTLLPTPLATVWVALCKGVHVCAHVCVWMHVWVRAHAYTYNKLECCACMCVYLCGNYIKACVKSPLSPRALHSPLSPLLSCMPPCCVPHSISLLCISHAHLPFIPSGLPPFNLSSSSSFPWMHHQRYRSQRWRHDKLAHCIATRTYISTRPAMTQSVCQPYACEWLCTVYCSSVFSNCIINHYRKWSVLLIRNHVYILIP